MSYLLNFPGLEERVATAVPSSKHAELLRRMHTADPRLEGAKVTATRGGAWLSKRKVLTAAGEIVHDDHREFLRQEIAGSGPSSAMRRLKELDYRLSQCSITTLFVVSDHGGRQECFVQAVVDLEDEFIDRRLFSSCGSGWWREPSDLDDLCNAAEDSEPLDGADRRRVRPSGYRLRRVVDMDAFLKEAGAVDERRRSSSARKVLRVTDLSTDGPSVERDLTIEQLDPDLMKFAWNGRRMFDDWSTSSAGHSGARICDQWAFQTSDYTDKDGVRWLSFVPAWTHTRKMAEIKRANSAYELFGKLESLDRRVGVPFAWYFYMLHGNLVGSWAGERVIEAAEAGLIVLQEHDYRVLKRWAGRPYGF